MWLVFFFFFFAPIHIKKVAAEKSQFLRDNLGIIAEIVITITNFYIVAPT